MMVLGSVLLLRKFYSHGWSVVTLRLKQLQFLFLLIHVDRDSAVGTATRYGLDSPGIETR